MRGAKILEYLKENNLPLVTRASLEKYGERHWVSRNDFKARNESLNDINSFVRHVEAKGIGQVERITLNVKKEGTGNFDEDGNEIFEEKTTQTVYVNRGKGEFVELERAKIPKVNVTPPKVLSKTPKTPSKPLKRNLAISLPDMQIGALERKTGTLEPTQDERAIDVAFQIMALVEKQHGIDLVVNQGDNLDFPMYSKHRSPSGYNTQRALQYAIDRGATIAATERKLAPKAEIVWLAGNHEHRYIKKLMDDMPETVGISRAWEEKPHHSIPELLRLDEFDVKYIDNYPDGEFWASDNLLFIHGSRVSSVPGTTAKNHLRDGVSVVHGHSHRQELLYRTTSIKGQEITSFAGSAGHLARQDGFLPSSSTGSTEQGSLAATKPEKWQQGIWLIWYDPEGKECPDVEAVKIQDGKAIFRGQEIISTVDKYGEKNV